MRKSLAKIGINLSRQQLIGFVLAVLAGILYARIIPFLFPIFYPILNIVFNKILKTAPDSFNRFVFTTSTFLVSFLVAYFSSKILKKFNKVNKN